VAYTYSRVPHRIPKKGSRKNKTQKPGASFHHKKLTANTPRLPRIPPRSHHQKTTTKTPVFAKSPEKTPQLPPQKNSAQAEKKQLIFLQDRPVHFPTPISATTQTTRPESFTLSP
jgi:hypothetical protein